MKTSHLSRGFCALMFLAILLPAAAVQAEPSAERGEYLVRGPAGCGNCHTPLGPEGPLPGMELAGRLVEDNPAFTAYAPNLTPAGPIGQWSDAELAGVRLGA